MYHARHLKPHHWVAAATALISVVALILGAAAVNGGLEASERPHRARPGTAATSVEGSTDTAPGTGRTAVRLALTDCRSAWASQGRALRAARSALSQWGVHIEAMNRLVAGRISAQQASSLWSASRTGAARRVARYQTADAETLGVFTRCSTPAVPADDAAQMRRLDACRIGAFARDDVLASARTAASRWRHHIHDMELLRAGRISATDALHRWHTNWRKGAAELRRYRHLRHVARGMAPC